MKHGSHLALLAVLIAASAAASAQDVNVYSTTMVQNWEQNLPGFDKSKFLPATEFLGVDATKLGSDKLSLHLYGWGARDFQDQSMPASKTDGDLTYCYLDYHFDQANADIKAGRFTVNQGVGNEQIDGISARTDLRGGFSISAFGGQPVIYKNMASNPQQDITYQRNMIFGTRLAYQIPKMGEVGFSYLQDGSHAAKDLYVPEPIDYTRKQAGVDMKLAPCSFITFTGRTVFDVASHPISEASATPSSIAEHDYSATFRITPQVTATGQFIERNFFAYYAGSTLPNLFNMNERGMFKATGGNVTWLPIENLSLIADVRRTDREIYGDATRYGLDARYNFTAVHVLAGAGFHKVNAFDVVTVDPYSQAYSLSHSEARAWAMLTRGDFSASLDAIQFHYTDSASNPNLHGKAMESEYVASLGYQLSTAFKASADLTYEDTAFYQKQVMGLLRVEYRFGFKGLGGK
jgi:hypothetical protein